MAEEIALAAEKAARNAKRAMVLTMLGLVVAVIVLWIDHGIKRDILTEAQKARQTLRELDDAAKERRNGATAARQSGSDRDSGHDGDRGVVHDPGTGPADGEAAAAAPAAPAKRAARVARGPQGDG